MDYPRINSLRIQGYRPFRDFSMSPGDIEVLVGANGSGKSSLFEFLKFLRDSLHEDIPPEIIKGSIGRQIFHIPGPEKFQWNIEIDFHEQSPIRYDGEIMGPIGRTHVSSEHVVTVGAEEGSIDFMDIEKGNGLIFEPNPEFGKSESRIIRLQRPNQLALNTATNPALKTLYNLREYIREWKFYSSFNISNDKIRKSVPIEQNPTLREDAGNLGSMLHFLMTEHPMVFNDLRQHLQSLVPGFRTLTVKARGGPGEVMAFWQEDGVDNELALSDLSDGTLRLLCWLVLCLQPNPPTLICVDEPDQGVHPRTLPLLAGLFEKAATRTQIILATHSSYFLMQFDISKITVLRKKDGGVESVKPKDSKILMDNLEDFGPDEIEKMHRNDELESFA